MAVSTRVGQNCLSVTGVKRALMTNRSTSHGRYLAVCHTAGRQIFLFYFILFFYV